jgi:hypothetical protein
MHLHLGQILLISELVQHTSYTILDVTEQTAEKGFQSAVLAVWLLNIVMHDLADLSKCNDPILQLISPFGTLIISETLAFRKYLYPGVGQGLYVSLRVAASGASYPFQADRC